MKKSATRLKAKSENGMSLVIVLIFMTVLSLLGITALQSSTLGANIARNEVDRNVAFQAAEAALKDAENDMRYRRFNGNVCTATDGCRAEAVSGTDFKIACTAGLCDSKTATTPVWNDSSKWSSSGASIPYGTYTGAQNIPMVSQQPRYLVEYFKLGESEVVRITAVGWGLNSSTRTTLQTSVKVRLL
jgi:type IV pilus assembly protein PilX